MKYFSNKQLIKLSRGILASNLFWLDDDIVYEDKDYKITVKKGFRTDGASIKFGKYIVGCNFQKQYLGPAIIHDALYGAHRLTREIADKLFHKALLDVGISRWKARLMYLAVSTFGQYTWDNKNTSQVIEARKHVEVVDAIHDEW